MKSKDGISTIEKINKYRESKQFPSKNELFWDVKQQEESDDEAPEEMSFQGFTKKSNLKMTKMSSKAKKALKEEKISKESSEDGEKVDEKVNDEPETLEDDIEDGNDDLLGAYSETESDGYSETNKETVTETIIRPKVPFNFKSSLLLRKRKEDDLYLDRQKQNYYFKKQKFSNTRN
uniref:Uncharacterized protein n=1 Tax=Strongyloides papillosus TaxID=174720 RepID=A0A0N5CDH5_STREA